MKRPIQTVHILEGKKKYSFDCVIKTEHTHTIEVLEDAKEAKEKKHVRYGVRKPSTIVMEVSVLDTVVVTSEPLTVGKKTRSESAYTKLYEMMQRRNYLTIITKFHTFNKMMLSDFVVTEDPDHQFEMYANIGFKEMIVSAPAKKKSNYKPAAEDKIDAVDRSVLHYSVYGDDYESKVPVKAH